MRRTEIWVGVVTAFALVCGAGASELEPCDDEQLGPRAECGVIAVPEDRGDSDGRTIGLNVVVLRAASPSGRSPVFVLAGGPGQGATDFIGLALGPWEPVNEERDIVLVDQRGTGQSGRLDCPVGAAEDPTAVFGVLFDPGELRSCLQELGRDADLRLYSSFEVVADLEEVRQRLGYERTILWGSSGGTRTALIWMKEHPDSVEAVLIDGVTPTWFRSPTTFAPGAQAALEQVFEDCAAEESCATASRLG